MSKEQIVGIYRNNELVAQVKKCTTSVETGVGLLKTPSLSSINGIHRGILMPIPKSRQRFSGFINSIHMIGMKYPIAVFWVNEAGVVVTKVFARPGLHIYSPKKPSVYVLELDQHAINTIDVGDVLEVRGN